MVQLQQVAKQHHLSGINHGYGLSTLLDWQQHPPVLNPWEDASQAPQVPQALVDTPARHRVSSSLDAIAQYWTHCAAIMGESLAHSLGLLDVASRTWPPSALRQAGVDTEHADMLPTVVEDGRVGHPMQEDHSRRLGLRAGVRILVPFGDNQAQTYGLAAALPASKPTLFINLGTSCQLTVIATAEQAMRIQVRHGLFLPWHSLQPSSLPQVSDAMLETRPYFAGQQLVTLATLNGGKVLAAMAESVASYVCCLSEHAS